MSLTPELVPPPEPSGSPPPTVVPSPPRHVGREDPVWNGWDVFLLVLVALACLFFVGGAVFAVGLHVLGRPGRSPLEMARDPRLLVPSQAASYVVLLLFMAALLRVRYHAPFWQTVRWRVPRGSACLGLAAAGVALAYGINFLSYIFPMPPSLPIDRFFHDATSAWLLAGFGILIAPPVEELFFRGFLYPVLERSLGLFWAVVLTSIPFALMHAQQLGSAWAPLFMLFLVSVVLTLTRAKSGSVAASVLLHMAYNTTLFTMLYFASDHFRHLEKAM